MKKTSKKTKLTRTTKSTKKQKHSQDFLKVYWPYLPLFALVFLGMAFGIGLPGKSPAISSSGVLAYATEMSTSALLSATNSQRANNGGLPGLTLNSKLAAAAQAKANDMVARNYWSHNTPDGKEPWTFVDAQGYDYQKAGENLAYGFDNSDATVTGWMNSPSHRANILDTSYKEVGFGFANGSDFVSTGEETVVVAMYGNPAVAAATTVNVSTPAVSQSVKASAAVVATTPVSAPAAQPTKIVGDTIEPVKETPKPIVAKLVNQAITSDSPIPASQPSTKITKLQTMTRGIAPWSAAALSATVLVVTLLWAGQHALIVKGVLVDGEIFLLHHPILDVGVMSLVALGVLLSRSSGVVK